MLTRLIWIFKMEEYVACIILNNKGEILLQKKTLDYGRYPGMWTIFGGASESKNHEREIKREIKEELGIDIKVKKEFKFAEKDNPEIGYVFSSEVNDLSKLSVGEGAGIAFFGKEELRDLKITPTSDKVIKMFFERK